MYDTNLENIKKAQKGDKQALEAIVLENSGLVWSIIKRFIGRGYEADDLYQIGCMGFIKAIQRFDTSYETKMSTYAVPYILGELKRFFRDDGMIKVSRSIKELAIKINDLQNEHQNKYGKELTINKIAEILNVSIEDVNVALEALVPVESINEEAYVDSTNGNLKKVDLIQDMKSEMINIEEKLAVKKLIEGLAEREKQIVMLRFYKGKTQMQVAKILKITQVQVSRIEKKILESMKIKLAC
ncbi:MAG: sigma-70 family RNA polymerase sigma factor [Lachnospiraceae bacterium]|nr:sigma-70 family RNA polymerase sigma factor [Lachnospiraceae bacterium]